MYTPNFSFSEKAIFYKGEINKTNSVAVHIRRGDYLNADFFTNLSKPNIPMSFAEGNIPSTK